MRRTRLAIPILLALILVGCTQSQITTSLQTVISVTQAALPIIGGLSGVDPKITQEVAKYLTAVNVAVGRTVEILDARQPGGLDTALVAAQIAQVFSGISKPLLPAGTPQNVVAVVQNLSNAVVAFLQNFKAPPSTRAKGPTISAQRFEFTYKDRKVLARARAEVRANDAKLVAIEVGR